MEVHLRGGRGVGTPCHLVRQKRAIYEKDPYLGERDMQGTRRRNKLGAEDIQVRLTKLRKRRERPSKRNKEASRINN